MRDISLSERIYQRVEQLPFSFQAEVLDFVDYLFSRLARRESEEWCAFSLASAMSGMEDEEPVYTIDDIKVVFG